MSRFDLGGRRAIVTGSGSGIGAAVAAGLVQAGADLVGLDKLLPSPGQGGAAASATYPSLACDVAEEPSVLEAFELARSILGGAPDVVVNVAGIGSTRTVAEETVERWDDVLAVNARGTFLVAREAVRGMVAAGEGGVIVNVASVAGQVGLRNRAAYCASKGAVIALSRAMAVDHAATGIRVNCVCPGTIRTPWVERLVNDAGESIDDLAARQLLGRLGEADEVADLIVYLASDSAAFATGAAFVLDGGLTAV